MNLNYLSICFHTDKIGECKEFYTKYFGAKLTFDHSWYVSVEFGETMSLQFMIPQDSSPLFGGNGTTLNMSVADVDAEYKRLITDSGLEAAQPLRDNPWGDRSFVVVDPIGNRLYIYSEIEPTDEYKAFYK